MPATSIPDIDLDHVAVALERHTDAWARYGGDLPSAWIGGGGTSGFWSAQVRYANGMKVEVLEPYQVEQNDFLRRFLDRNGPGPHHLTYKVKSLAGALESAEAAGYRPVGVNLANAWWKEAFLHPKDAPGVVVQLAESNEGGDWGGDTVAPEWFPEPRTARPAELVHVAHAVADMDEGTKMFVDLLSGSVTGEGEDAGGGVRWIDVGWPGPGRVRLLAGPALAPWLDGRAGRVHHLAFTADRPETVPDAIADEANPGTVEVRPQDNHGVRLRIASSPEPFARRALG